MQGWDPQLDPTELRGWGSLSKPNGEQDESDPVKRTLCELMAHVQIRQNLSASYQMS